MNSPLVAVTGVTGFIGHHVAARLTEDGFAVRGIARREVARPPGVLQLVLISEKDGTRQWCDAVSGVDTVVHLAARTHAVRDRGQDNLGEYRRVNVEGSRRLAEAAASSGVRRLVFVSSIKVNGERTVSRPFRAGDAPAPEDAYGVSKWEAEQVIAEVGAASGLETVIVRPPLVYGPGARGNFARLSKAVRRGIVLPLGAVMNRRSLVAIDNLVDLIVCCAAHPSAPGQTFLVSDGEDLSTSELVRRLAAAMGTRPRLLPVPPGMLRLAGKLAGRSAEVSRLVDSLQVDIEHTRRTLGWRPPVSVLEGLIRAVAHA